MNEKKLNEIFERVDKRIALEQQINGVLSEDTKDIMYLYDKLDSYIRVIDEIQVLLEPVYGNEIFNNNVKLFSILDTIDSKIEELKKEEEHD